MNKLCPSCKLDKPISEFGKSKSRKDGLAHSCLLCTDCNWGLGNFKDSPEIMLAAIAYIGEQQLKS